LQHSWSAALILISAAPESSFGSDRHKKLTLGGRPQKADLLARVLQNQG